MGEVDAPIGVFDSGIGGLTVLDWTFIAVCLGCVQTIWLRLVRILRSLRAPGDAAIGAGSEDPHGGR